MFLDPHLLAKQIFKEIQEVLSACEQYADKSITLGTSHSLQQKNEQNQSQLNDGSDVSDADIGKGQSTILQWRRMAAISLDPKTSITGNSKSVLESEYEERHNISATEDIRLKKDRINKSENVWVRCESRSHAGKVREQKRKEV